MLCRHCSPMEPCPAVPCYPLAAGTAQKILWVCLHVYHCSSTEQAPRHAQTPSKFKSSASWLGNRDLDSLLLLSKF